MPNAKYITINALDLCKTLHCIPMATKRKRKIQKDRNMPNLCENEERLPDLLAGPAVWTSS